MDFGCARRRVLGVRLYSAGAAPAVPGSLPEYPVFKRRNRLSRAVFETTLKSGKRRSSTHFSIVRSETESGYAVVVSKKTARLSVTRHRIKRRILEVLRTLPLPKGLIVFPRAGVKDMGYDEMQLELTKLLS